MRRRSARIVCTQDLKYIEGSCKDYFSICEFLKYAEARAVLLLKHSFVYIMLRGLNIEARFNDRCSDDHEARITILLRVHTMSWQP